MTMARNMATAVLRGKVGRVRPKMVKVRSTSLSCTSSGIAEPASAFLVGGNVWYKHEH